jgi:hypothetical protein
MEAGWVDVQKYGRYMTIQLMLITIAAFFLKKQCIEVSVPSWEHKSHHRRKMFVFIYLNISLINASTSTKNVYRRAGLYVHTA